MSLGSFPEKHQRMAVHRGPPTSLPLLDEPSPISLKSRPDEVKDRRTAVHHFLSRRFGKLVETKSFNDPGGTVISVRLRPRKRTKDDSVEEEVYTRHSHCVRRTWRLWRPISYMAATLGAVASDFSYAGIKDKRAVTYQANGGEERARQKADREGGGAGEARAPRDPAEGCGRRGGAGRGEHQGQRVRQLLRTAEVRHQPEVRQSDRVGLALLKEDMVGAVRLFFTPENGDEQHNQAKRHFIQTENAKESLVLMPASKARERLMLRALHRYGPGADGCTRAWLSLPHGMRVFYPHAYCSRVWNEAVAHRLATLGHAPIQGDLVWQQQDPQGDMGESNPPQIHVVSSEEERDGVYTLAQVVLPMPGNTVTYPQNAMGAWYRERLASDGLGDGRFRITGLKLNLPGCYRPLVVTPRNITHRLQERREEEKEEEGRGGEEMARRRESEKAPLTLVMNFDLVSSSYATVCLREMMKYDV
ncbi:unnamed protein product [Arctogadus glacialis]